MGGDPGGRGPKETTLRAVSRARAPLNVCGPAAIAATAAAPRQIAARLIRLMRDLAEARGEPEPNDALPLERACEYDRSRPVSVECAAAIKRRGDPPQPARRSAEACP